MAVCGCSCLIFGFVPAVNVQLLFPAIPFMFYNGPSSWVAGTYFLDHERLAQNTLLLESLNNCGSEFHFFLCFPKLAACFKAGSKFHLFYLFPR
jgi:hypothetical protein